MEKVDWNFYLNELENQKNCSDIYNLVDFNNYPERFDADLSNYKLKFNKYPKANQKLILDTFKVSSIEDLIQSEEFDKVKFLSMYGDTLSDAYANLLPKYGFQELQSKLKIAFSKGIGAVENPPEELVKLYAQMNAVPEWISLNDVEVGAKQTRVAAAVSNLYMIKSAFILTFFNDYAGFPMILTGSLSDPITVKKRTCETLSFFESACLPGALDKGGLGLYSAAMVRFMHSVVRYNLMTRDNIWNTKVYGVAIPKVDSIMAVFLETLIGISLYGFDGIKNNPSKIASFNYSRYLAYLLGVKEEYIPKTIEELVKQAFLRNLTLKSKSESEKSLELANAVNKVNFFEESFVIGRIKNNLTRSLTKLMLLQIAKLVEEKAINHFKIKLNFLDYLKGGFLFIFLFIKGNGTRQILINFPKSKLASRLDLKNIKTIKNHLTNIYGHADFVTNVDNYKI